jgi:hypothetical protein
MRTNQDDRRLGPRGKRLTRLDSAPVALDTSKQFSDAHHIHASVLRWDIVAVEALCFRLLGRILVSPPPTINQ